MLKPSEIERLSMSMDKPMRVLESRIMSDIIRRIKENGGEITRAADWQIYRLHELGMAQEDIDNAIQSALNISDEEMQEMYRNVLAEGYAYDSEIYKKAGVPRIPFEDNLELQQLISAVGKQTADEFKNITRSLGFAVRNPDGTLSFQPVAKYYQEILDNAVMGIASGVFDYNTALKKAVAELTNSGLRTVDYASGWSNRVDVAARRAIMTGLSQLTAKVNESNAKELGTDMYEVTWHSGARPSHQVWQGKWYTHQELIDICGLGSVTGLCGANCYHDYYPVIPGISEPTYTQEELDRMNAEENRKTEFRGKEYTKYEALQRQRKLETVMRAERRKIKLLEEGGADEGDILNAKAKYRGTSHEYAEFSKAMELPQQRQRVTVADTPKTRKFVDNSGESGIIRTTEVVNADSVVGVWNPRDGFESLIDDVIDYQGFNGKPTIIYEQSAFDDAVEKDHFLAERTLRALNKDKLKQYNNQLKAVDGEDYFYVNCGVGGAQYGQGMYCAADYSKGKEPFENFLHEIKEYGDGSKNPDGYFSTTWMTLDPSAKILVLPNGQKAGEFIPELYKREYMLKYAGNQKDEVVDYIKKCEAVDNLTFKESNEVIDKAYAERDLAFNKVKELNQEALRHTMYVPSGGKFPKSKDPGVLAAEMGYDAINAVGHGATKSYTAVLNRTKLIIFGGENYVYPK